MAYVYRAKNGDATNEYRFPSAATANALALKFNLDPDPISVCSDAECRNDVGDISAIGAGTYYVDGRPHTAQGPAPADRSQEIIDGLAEIKLAISDSKTKSIPLSGMTATKAQALLQSICISIEVHSSDIKLDEKYKSLIFTPHIWGARQDDPGENNRATEFLKKEIEKYGVPLDRAGFAVRSTDKTKLFKSVGIGRLIMSGGCDAVIVPYKISNTTMVTQLRVIIEYKTTEELDNTDPQCIGELICGLALSQHMILAVKTDLRTRFDFWTPLEDGGYEEWRCTDARIALQHIARFLNTASKDHKYKENNMDAVGLLPMLLVRNHLKGGIMEEQIGIIDELPIHERIPAYIEMMMYSQNRFDSI